MGINQDLANQEKLDQQKAYIEAWKTRNSKFEKLPDAFKNNDYVLFPREYYSGSDIFICFGNIPIENILSVEFQVLQNFMGLYGYASYTWDAPVTGNRYIEGSFKINFKESFYIKSILDKLLNGEDYSEKVTSVDLSGINTINDLTDKIRNLNQEELKNIAKEYENRLWGTEKPIDNRYNAFLLENFSTYDYINEESAWASSYNSLLKRGFDIIISFGEEMYEIKGQKHSENNTMKTINGVHITGYKTVYEPNGTPVFEEYRFVARDIDNSVSIILPKEIEEKIGSTIKMPTPINKGGSNVSNKMLTMLE